MGPPSTENAAHGTGSAKRPVMASARFLLLLLAMVPACAGSFADEHAGADGYGSCTGCDDICPFEGVYLDEEGQACATCDATGATICGAARVAPCESRAGTRADCSICDLGGGEYLYENCFAPLAVGGRCFAALDVAQPGRECEICFDEGGQLTHKECGPSYTRIEEGPGALCDTYYDGQNVAFVDCDRAHVSPYECRVYENEQGRCVDCYDDALPANLLLHECTFRATPDADPAVRCEDKVVADGRMCTVCSDARGAFVRETCDLARTDDVIDYGFLAIEGHECTVGLDVHGRLRALKCAQAPCAGGDCVAPDSCVFQLGGEDVLCGTCETFAGATRSACFDPEGAGWTCSEQYVDSAEPGAPQHTCTVCRDASGYEFVDCEESGYSAPPSAPSYEAPECTAIGDGTCRECFYPQSGSSFILCDDGTCQDSPGTYAVTNDVVAQCQSCSDATSSDDVTGTPYSSYQRCYVDRPCAPDGVKSTTDGACPTLRSWAKQVAPCGQNEWEDGDEPQSPEELVVAVMRFGFESAGVPIYSGAVVPGYAAPTTCQGSCCFEGDTVRVDATPEEGWVLEAYGWQPLE